MKIKGIIFTLLGLITASVCSSISINNRLSKTNGDTSIYSNYYYVEDTNNYVDGGYYFITIDQIENSSIVSSYYVKAATGTHGSTAVEKYENRDEIDKSNLFKLTIGDDGYATITNYENKYLFGYEDSLIGLTVGDVTEDNHYNKWTITPGQYYRNVLSNYRGKNNFRYLAVRIKSSTSYQSYLPSTIDGADAADCHFGIRLLKYEDDTEKTIKVAFTTNLEKNSSLFGPFNNSVDSLELENKEIPYIDYDNSSNLDKLQSINFMNCKHGWFSGNTVKALQLGDATWYEDKSAVSFILNSTNIVVTKVSAVMYSYKSNETCYAMINGIKRAIGTMREATLVNGDANYGNIVEISGAKGPTNYGNGTNDDKYGSLRVYSVSISYRPIAASNTVNDFIRENRVETQLSFKYDKFDNTTYKIYEAGLAYRIKFSDEEYSAFKTLGTDVKFGFQFLNDGKFVRKEYSQDLSIKTNKEMAIRITGITNFTTALIVSAYVEVDGAFHYTQFPRSYSVNTISFVYYTGINSGKIEIEDDTKTDVLNCLNLMKAMDVADPWPNQE